MSQAAVRPRSTFCCSVTPFTPEGALDEDAIRLLVERWAAAGVGAYLGTASPGEGHSLTLAETERLYATAKEAAAGRIQVRAMGREPRSADELMPILDLAADVGLDAMQLYSLDLGHGMKPTPAEQERYFRELLEHARLPTVLSTHFLSTFLIPIDVIARLLDDYPQLIGINCTSPDLTYVGAVLDVARGRADVHVGGPQQALTALAMGAQGFLSTEALLIPRTCGEIIRCYDRGDLEGAAAAYAEVMRFSRINVWADGSVRFTKAAMTILGLPGGTLRRPFLPLGEADVERLRQSLDALDIDELRVRV